MKEEIFIYFTSSSFIPRKPDLFYVVLRGLVRHHGSSVTHTQRGWGWVGGDQLPSWSIEPVNGSVGRHTHGYTQTYRRAIVCLGEAERCNVARSGCG